MLIDLISCLQFNIMINRQPFLAVSKRKGIANRLNLLFLARGWFLNLLKSCDDYFTTRRKYKKASAIKIYFFLGSFLAVG
jgi:hypothetical protein